MYRCLELARLAAGYTAPNPMVGSVLVYEDRIIGEGYHEIYGQAHAEVNCIRSVKPEDEHLIALSTIYVSLEPCAHHGKTPPCADLIIAKKIPRVVVGCRDPFPLVDGKGIEKLREAGIEVVLGVLEKECVALNKRFFTFHVKHRPYIILKWAQTANGRIAGGEGSERLLISNAFSQRLVHKWRAEEASILVGTRTALLDDPALTVRSWKGPDPIRLVIDKRLELPSSLRLFDRTVPTIVFNDRLHEEGENLSFYQLATDSSLVQQIVMALHRLKIDSVLIEGGARLLQSFIDEGMWDEARVITNESLLVSEGLAAPVLGGGRHVEAERAGSDRVDYYRQP